MSVKTSIENYFQSLKENNKLAYKKKITLESDETLPNLYSLRNDWIEDVNALPEVSWEM